MKSDQIGNDCKSSISGNHPNINTDNVHLHHDSDDSGLRSREKVTAKPHSLITTTSQSQQQVEEDIGLLKTKSSTTKPAIRSNSQQAENIDKGSVTTAPPSEMLETREATLL